MPATWLDDLEHLLDEELSSGPVDSPFRPAVLRWGAAKGRPADPRPLLDQQTARVEAALAPVSPW